MSRQPSRTPRRRRLSRTTRLVLGLGLAASLIAGTAASAGAVPSPPPNPSDADLAAAGVAVAAGVDQVGSLILRIATADQQLAELENQVAVKRENVNRALVDLQSARDAADAAAHAVALSQQALKDAGTRIRQAQQDFDAFARDSYVQGTNVASLASFIGSTGPDDLLDRAQIMRLLSAGRTVVLDALERARTEQANRDSRARASKQEADAAAAAAEERRAAAEAAIAEARTALAAQTAEKQRIEQDRAQAQAELDRARGTVTGLEGQRAQYAEWDRQRQAEEAAAAAAETAARQAAADAARRVAADADARARAAELANGQRPHTQIDDYVRPRPAAAESGESEVGFESPLPPTSDATTTRPGRTTPEQDESGTDGSGTDGSEDGTDGSGTDGSEDGTGGSGTDGSGDGTDGSGDGTDGSGEPTTDGSGESDSEDSTIPDRADPVEEEGTTTSPPTRSRPRTTPKPGSTLGGTAAVETVIDRAMSQIGVPYAWGGGDENGPTLGIRDGGVADSYGDYNKVGFDCSGLMIYAFAGIGISLPHYTGYQYTAGEQVPSAEMRRGDMIFYGPNASQHVGLYLGDGQMIEAPQSGSHVKISPVRWDGMTPYVVRMVS
ncbi:Rpf-interacting protein [Rhodococcus sp. WB1]|uniref:NlpC/P60 family protein n=1 Tax=unclassified Rhodococcus (in: high G+C Gram-positive bacteria) TaxID=192944 RepID=UPI00081A3C14|nr:MULTISPECIES: NlpC/P60 family protein [unclassified Rhodococcus (in: high G+C Gram-positive bacteria)]ANZ25213.1 Rpf-interacting protein [Rhodococcus sp. WB1]USC17960.1 C40 family peptidase [Rhodococcus sp. 11-3]